MAQEVTDARVPLVRVARVEDDLGAGEELDQLGEEEGARHVDNAGVPPDRRPHQLERALLVVGHEFGVARLGPEFDVGYRKLGRGVKLGLVVFVSLFIVITQGASHGRLGLVRPQLDAQWLKRN